MALFLLVAPSGSGKTTIAQDIQKQGLWKEVISHTTRDMRNGEVDGETYYYIDKLEFKNMKANGKFVETTEYHGNLYGIAKSEIDSVLDSGKNAYIIVNIDGYNQIKDIYEDAIGIFIYMSKEDCLANMLLRGDKYENAISRIATYEEELDGSIQCEYVIKNVRNKMQYTQGIIKNIVYQNSGYSDYIGHLLSREGDINN